MTLEELLDLQQEHGLGHVHMVDLGRDDFRLAHTDDERANGTNDESCRIHQWLAGFDAAPAPEGVYIVAAHEADAYSESYRSDPWDLHPLFGVIEQPSQCAGGHDWAIIERNFIPVAVACQQCGQQFDVTPHVSPAEMLVATVRSRPDECQVTWRLDHGQWQTTTGREFITRWDQGGDSMISIDEVVILPP